MPGSTDFIWFGTGGEPNVQDQADYAASSAVSIGFVSGIAQSAPINKALRQGTFGSAVLGTFIGVTLGIDQADDGNLTNAVTNFQNALLGFLQASQGARKVYNGNPNGNVAGNAGSVGPPAIFADICEDVSTGHLWVCVTSGNAASAVWNLGASSGITSLTAGTGLTGGTITTTGTIALATATTSQLGGVKVDGTSITISAGVISAASAGGNVVGPNPTVAGDFAVWNNTSGTLLKDVAAATASQIWVGTDNGSPVTSSGLAAASAFQVLADASTTPWAMGSGYMAKWTLGGNRTLGAPTGAIIGRTYSLLVYQPASGGPCTVTWPTSFDWGGAGAPSLSTGASVRDRVDLLCETTSPLKFSASFWPGS